MGRGHWTSLTYILILAGKKVPTTGSGDEGRCLLLVQGMRRGAYYWSREVPTTDKRIKDNTFHKR